MSLRWRWQKHCSLCLHLNHAGRKYPEGRMNMIEISEIRENLREIPNALERDQLPAAPRYRGDPNKILKVDIEGFSDDNDVGSLRDLTDTREVEELFRELDDAVGAGGVEALAWYHPFHISSSQWGIYIPLTSLHYIADRWLDRRMGLARRASLALEILLSHEVVHHACEYAVAQFEIFLRAPCWAPARERLRGAKLNWFDDEEALANANSVRQISLTQSQQTVDRLHHSLLNSPRGYRDFPSALSDAGFQDHTAEVLRHNVGIPAVDLQTGFLSSAFDPLAFFPDLEEAGATCPIYLIDDSKHFKLPPLTPQLITCISNIVETRRFEKMFRKLDARRQEEWRSMKDQLARAVPRHPYFKKLSGNLRGYWGIYLRDGFRAHIRPAGNSIWEADEIGPHSAMGHG